jgi:aspartate racemase
MNFENRGMYKRKKLGILGGMGSRAGALLLQKIIDYSPADSDQEFPDILFHNNSNIPDRTRAIVYNERSPVRCMLQSIDLFNENRVEVIVMGCVTSYYYYEQIREYTDAEIINPLHLIVDSIRNNYESVNRVGLLATTGTIRSGLFQKYLDGCDVEINTLNEADQENLFMRSVYMKNGFKSAAISENAQLLMDQCVEALRLRGADLIIGGCTEVSVSAVRKTMSIPYIDVLDIMAKKAVDCCYGLKKYSNTVSNE